MSCSSSGSSVRVANAQKAFELLQQASGIAKNSADQGLKERFDKIARVLGDDSKNIRFTYCRDNALLHDHVASIVKAVELDHALKAVWREFLRNIHGVEVCYPDGHQRMTLNFLPEISCLDSSKMPAVSIVDLDSKISPVDRDAIWEIQNESFGAYELPSRKEFETWYQNSSHTLLVARDEHTNLIEGFLLACEQDDVLEIAILARRANAAKRGVGSQLLTEVIKRKSTAKILLCVRESHEVAIKLYKQFGFVESGHQAALKACPVERDVVMIRQF